MREQGPPRRTILCSFFGSLSPQLNSWSNFARAGTASQERVGEIVESDFALLRFRLHKAGAPAGWLAGWLSDFFSPSCLSKANVIKTH